MTTERRRRALFAALLGVAILGAAALMVSVLVGDMTWRVALQIAGLATCAAASLAVVLTVRRWGAADDFWWLDSGPAAEPGPPATGRDRAHIPGPDTDR